MHRRDQRPPDLLDRAWSAFAASLVAPFAESWRSTVVTAAIIGALGALLASAPALYLEEAPLDVFLPLDAAWRMAHGQWPHLDFPSSVGALWYVLLDLAGPGPLAPLRASLLLVPFTTGAALVVTRARLPTPLRLGVVLLIAVGTLSPRDLDSVGRLGGFASADHLGWVLVSIVIAGALIAPRLREARGAVVEVAMLSLAVVATFYLDLEIFLACLGALVLAMATGGENRGLAAATALVSLAVIVAGFAVGETNAAYVGDLSAPWSSGRVLRLGPALIGNRGAALALALALAAFWRTAHGATEARQASALAGRVGGVALLLWVVGAHSDHDAIPALPTLLAAAYAGWRERWVQRADEPLPMQLVGGLTLAFVAVPITLDAAAVVRHTAGAWSSSSVALVELDADHTRRLRTHANAGNDEADHLRDAVHLLRRLDLADRRVASLTETQPFPWLLGAPPPRGLPGRLLARSGDAAECRVEALADAEVVLVPAIERADDRSCESTIRAQFAIADRTAAWTVWTRVGSVQ